MAEEQQNSWRIKVAFGEDKLPQNPPINIQISAFLGEQNIQSRLQDLQANTGGRIEMTKVVGILNSTMEAQEFCKQMNEKLNKLKQEYQQLPNPYKLLPFLENAIIDTDGNKVYVQFGPNENMKKLVIFFLSQIENQVPQIKKIKGQINFQMQILNEADTILEQFIEGGNWAKELFEGFRLEFTGVGNRNALREYLEKFFDLLKNTILPPLVPLWLFNSANLELNLQSTSELQENVLQNIKPPFSLKDIIKKSLYETQLIELFNFIGSNINSSVEWYAFLPIAAVHIHAEIPKLSKVIEKGASKLV